MTSATLGEQGKSEKDIVRFASSLTSAEFDVSDIIFSKRIPLQEKEEYRIQGEDYIAIKEALGKTGEIKIIADKYGICLSASEKEILYELLVRDENVHKLSSLLSKSSKDFSVIYNEMFESVSQEQLIALIDIINAAEKNGIGLFDLKYHSFVRPLSGAYVSYGKEPKLSLTKTNEIDGMKAFEIVNIVTLLISSERYSVREKRG